MKTLGWTTLTLLLLTGCATGPHSKGSWPDAPPDGYATLIAYRRGPVTLNKFTITIDQTKVFGLRNNDYSWTYVPAGEHLFRVSWKESGFYTLRSRQVNLLHDFHAGQLYYVAIPTVVHVRPFIPARPQTTVRQVPAAEGRKEIETCDFRRPIVRQVDAQSQPDRSGIITPLIPH